MSLEARAASISLVLAAAVSPAPASADWVATASTACRDGSDNGADSSIGFTPALAEAQFDGRSGASAGVNMGAAGGYVSLYAEVKGVGLGRESTESDGCVASASGSASSLIFIDTPVSGSGTASVTVKAHGELAGESSSTSSVYSAGGVSWGISFGNQGRSGTLNLRDRFGVEQSTTSGDALGTHTFSVTVQFDSWVPLTVSAAANIGTFDYGALSGFFLPGTASMSALFHNIFEFIGINELRDSAGNLVEFTAFDQDGRNYRIGATPPTPVPEPPGWTLFGAAACAFGAVRRRLGSAPRS
jgi:hypothetical protein